MGDIDGRNGEDRGARYETCPYFCGVSLVRVLKDADAPRMTGAR